MKILHVGSTYKPAWHRGGAVRATSQLCQGLALTGQDVSVYTTDSDGINRLGAPRDVEVMRRGVKVTFFHVIGSP
jgi:glycogen synthase